MQKRFAPAIDKVLTHLNQSWVNDSRQTPVFAFIDRANNEIFDKDIVPYFIFCPK
jgi:hypothetical protein